MILTDRVNTFTYLYPDEKAQPIYNSNVNVTIGGVVKSQADSQRLKITIGMRLTQTQMAAMSAVLKNFSQTLYYTPTRKLYDKSAIAELTVICQPPQIDELAYNGEIIYYCTLELEEVISN